MLKKWYTYRYIHPSGGGNLSHILETQHAYFVQPRRRAQLASVGRCLCGDQFQAVKIWKDEAVVHSFYILNCLPILLLGPEEDFASLWVSPRESFGVSICLKSQGLWQGFVLISATHIHWGLHLLPTSRSSLPLTSHEIGLHYLYIPYLPCSCQNGPSGSACTIQGLF